MPRTIAPGTRRATRTVVSHDAAMQSHADPKLKSPGPTKVAGLATITPPYFSPMKAMNIPTPQLTAIFMGSGIRPMIFSRMPVIERARTSAR